MYRITSFLLFAFALFTFNLNAQETKQKTDYAKEGYVKAIIVDHKVEDCGFLIELSDKEKTKLVPDKLDAAFKKHKLKVWVKFTLAKKQEMSTCMAGKQCVLVDIKKRK